MKRIIEKIKNKLKQPLNLAVLSIFSVYLVFHIIPIYKNGDVAFGYDTGIYRHYIVGYYEKIGDDSVVPFGFSSFSNILRLMGENVDKIMYGWYFLLSFFILLSLYCLVKNIFDKKTAVMTIFLYSFSITQYNFYLYYLYRNFLALFFILLSLLLLNKKSYLSVFPIICLGIIHPLSLIPLGLSLIFYLFLSKKEDGKFIFFSGLISLIIILILNFNEYKQYLPFFTENYGLSKNFKKDFSGEFSGQFMNLWDFFKFGLMYIPFSVLGLVKLWKKNYLFFLFLICNIFLILVGFIFYKRFFVFLDLVFIVYAGAFLSFCINEFKTTKTKFLIGSYYVAVVFFIFLNFFINAKPLIEKNELQDILSLNNFDKSRYLITISSHYAPWVYGFADFRIIAPGMFEYNKWNMEKWILFWTTPDQNIRKDLLSVYDEEKFYIFLGEKDRGFENVLLEDSSAKKINNYLWEYDRLITK